MWYEDPGLDLGKGKKKKKKFSSGKTSEIQIKFRIWLRVTCNGGVPIVAQR